MANSNLTLFLNVRTNVTGAADVQQLLAALQALGNVRINVPNPGGRITPQANQASQAVAGLRGSLSLLTNAYALAGAAAVKFASASLKSATDANKGFQSLKVLTQNIGLDFTKLWKVIEELSADGVIKQSELADAAKFFIQGGAKNSELLIQMMRDSATLAKDAARQGKDAGQVLTSAAEGFLTGQSDLFDNIGVQTNFDKIYANYARSIHTVTDALTDLEKAEAIAQALRKQAQLTAGSGGQQLNEQEQSLKDYAQATAQMGTAWETLKTKVGSAMAVMGAPLVRGITAVLNNGFTPFVWAIDKISEAFGYLLRKIGEFKDAVTDSSLAKAVRSVLPWYGSEPAAPTTAPASMPPAVPAPSGTKLVPKPGSLNDSRPMPTLPGFENLKPTKGAIPVFVQNPDFPTMPKPATPPATVGGIAIEPGKPIPMKGFNPALTPVPSMGKTAFGADISYNPNVAAITSNKALLDKDTADAKNKRDRSQMERDKQIAEATEAARNDIFQQGLNTRRAELERDQQKGLLTVANVARAETGIRLEELGRQLEQIDRDTARNNAAIANNKDDKGEMRDLDRGAQLEAENQKLIGQRQSVLGQMQQLSVENEKKIAEATLEIDSQTSAIKLANLQKELDQGQAQFQADLDTKQANLDLSLAQQLTSQRGYLAKTKEMRLAEIDEEERQNRNRLEQAQARVIAPSDKVGRAQQAAEVETLNAAIALSTQKRAKVETEALKQVLDLEETIKSARASLAATALELAGKPYEAQLAQIAEDARTFEKQFSGEMDLINQKRALADMQRAKASFDEQKRLSDERVSFLTLATEKINFQVEQGRMTGAEAEKAIREERLKTADAILKQVEAMEKLAAASPENMSLGLQAQQARFEYEKLAKTVDQFAVDSNKALAEGFLNAIPAAKNWGDVARGTVTNFLSFLQNVFSKRAAEALGNWLGGGADGGGFNFGSALSSGFNWLGGMLGFAEGGAIRGAGTGTSDSILAKLSNGEYVIKASSVAAVGLDTLHHINSLGRLPAFATGGYNQAGLAVTASAGAAAAAPSVPVQQALYFDPHQAAEAIAGTSAFDRHVTRLIAKHR